MDEMFKSCQSENTKQKKKLSYTFYLEHYNFMFILGGYSMSVAAVKTRNRFAQLGVKIKIFCH